MKMSINIRRHGFVEEIIFFLWYHSGQIDWKAADLEFKMYEWIETCVFTQSVPIS